MKKMSHFLKQFSVAFCLIVITLQASGQNMSTRDAISLTGGGYMCVSSGPAPVKKKSLAESHFGPNFEADNDELFGEEFFIEDYGQLSCEKKTILERFVGGTALSLHLVAIGLACTGVGAPATLGVEIAAGGVHLVEFLVGFIDCKDLKTDKQIKDVVDQRVCEALERSGILCVPALLDDRPITPIKREHYL